MQDQFSDGDNSNKLFKMTEEVQGTYGWLQQFNCPDIACSALRWQMSG